MGDVSQNIFTAGNGIDNYNYLFLDYKDLKFENIN